MRLDRSTRAAWAVRCGLRAALACIVVGLIPTVSAAADEYPSRPIRLVVDTGPGGAGDIRARFLSSKLADALKQPIVVENRPGASGSIAAEQVARAQPDGYTMLVGGAYPLVTYPATGGNYRYDADRDFAPVAVLTYGFPVLVAHPGSGLRSMADIVARAKADPDALTCGTSGNGGLDHLGCAWIAHRSGIRIRPVHYKSSAPAVQGAASGEVHLAIGYLVYTEKQYLVPGKLVPIAVLGPDRLPQLPTTPTIAEAGLPGVDMPGWVGIFAPARTPAAIVTRMNAEALKAMKDPVNLESMRQAGTMAPDWSPEKAGEFVRRERAMWSRVAGEVGIKAE